MVVELLQPEREDRYDDVGVETIQRQTYIVNQSGHKLGCSDTRCLTYGDN